MFDGFIGIEETYAIGTNETNRSLEEQGRANREYRVTHLIIVATISGEFSKKDAI